MTTTSPNISSNFTQNDDDSSCGGATDLELQWFLNFSWWVEGFLQLATGILQDVRQE